MSHVPDRPVEEIVYLGNVSKGQLERLGNSVYAPYLITRTAPKGSPDTEVGVYISRLDKDHVDHQLGLDIFMREPLSPWVQKQDERRAAIVAAGPQPRY